LILVESRYVAPYFLLLCGPLFLATDAFRAANPALARAAAFALPIIILPMLGWGISDERQAGVDQDNLNVATAVERSGIVPGDKIAFVGDAISAYWAKLDGVKIIAEIPSHYWKGQYRPVSRMYWESPEGERAAILGEFENLGARAVLAWRPATGVPSGWREIGGTGLCMRRLN
jgi:hypothetical protein